MRRLSFHAAAIATALAMWSGAAFGQDDAIAHLFKGKSLRIVLGSAPGQDYDLWGRFLARHVGRHLPGNPAVVVQNMPGAGEMLAANWLYNLAPRDGTVWGSVGRNISNAAFQGAPGARYDPIRFHWLGSPETTNRGCFAMATAKVQKAEDLFEHELVVGTIGAGATVSETPNLMRGLLGMKFKTVDGYVRPQDVVLAMERGELEGVCQTVQSFSRAKPDWLKDGTARVLFTAERDPVPGIDAPSVFQFAKTDEQRAILAFVASTLELGRPYMLPPEVPANVVQAMRRAFDATVNDPAFRQEAVKIGVVITHQTGEQIQERVLQASRTPPEIIARANELGLRSKR
jgi:tripartite-type tricarboxylate transporter receptor subunit TctC